MPGDQLHQVTLDQVSSQGGTTQHYTLYRPAAASHTEMNIALIWHNLRGERELSGGEYYVDVEPD